MSKTWAKVLSPGTSMLSMYMIKSLSTLAAEMVDMTNNRTFLRTPTTGTAKDRSGSIALKSQLLRRLRQEDL